MIADKLSLGLPLSKHEFLSRLGVRRKQGDRVLTHLATRGLVALGAGADDKSVALVMTKGGRELHERLETKWEEWMKVNPEAGGALGRIRVAARTVIAGLKASV